MDISTKKHGNLIDLAGKVFGRLTAIRRDGDIKPARWICSCACGSTKSVRANKLASGATKSCGCLKSEVTATKATRDVSGQKIGRLSIICREGSSGNKSMWLAVCECGTVKRVSGLYLRTSKEPSCGCAEYEAAAQRMFSDLSGKVFGKLTALEHVGFDQSRKAMWRCLCSCGGEKIVRGNNLVSGRTISCGCAQKDDAIYMTESARAESAIKCATRRARKRNAPGAHTQTEIDDLFKKQRGKCAGCGVSIAGGYHRDRIVSLAKGGSNDVRNIQLLCGPCNHDKNAKDPIDWAQENGRLL